MDHLTVTKRAKSSCEIQEDATLVTCLLFNKPTPYVDHGTNSLSSTESLTTIISSGHSKEAISFNGSSFFQTSSFTSLGISNKSFSVALWLRPQSVLNNVVHLSADSSGLGNAWCVAILSLRSNGTILNSIYNGTGTYLWSSSISMTPTWTHVVQTYSLVNGFRSYVNGILISSIGPVLSYSASGKSNFYNIR